MFTMCRIQPEDDGKEHEAEHCEDDYEDDGENGNSCHKKAQTNGTEHKDIEYTDWEESTLAAISQSPSTSSTTAPTTTRPTLTSSSSQRPTTPPPKFLYQRPELLRPPTTADPSLQLLALHESFQQNIKQQDASKLRPINVAPTPPKNSSTAFSFSKTPLPYPSFPSNGPLSAAPSAKPSFYPPLPSKLPNTLSNLSQKPSSSFASSQTNSNRTPPGSSAPPFYKPEPASYFSGSGNSNKHSQKVTLPPPQSLPAGVSVQKQQEPPVLFTYKIVGDGRPDRFRPTNTIQYNFATNPVSDSSSTFKMETPSAALPHPTFVAIAQGRPFTFRPQPAQFAHHQRSTVNDAPVPAQFAQHQRSAVNDARAPAQFTQHQRSTVDDSPTSAQFAQNQRTDIDDADQSDESPIKSDDYDSHTNFARAIAERPKNVANGSDAAAISVVLRTSSVSSSISSKPQSAITNSTTHPLSSANVLHQPYGAVGQKVAFDGGHHSFVSTLRSNALGATSSMRPNITEINEALTEEPYYEEGDEGANIEYDENSPEYKDIAYPSDVRKIRQR